MSHFCSLRRMVPALVVLGILGFVLPAAAGELRPFRGKANETVTDETPDGVDQVLIALVATGEATHLGRFTGTEEIVYDVADNTVTGTRVFIAANGDQLYANVEGEFTSPTTVSGTFTFTGGTGRFRNASGTADFEVVTPDGIHLSLTFDGTIKY